jgi:hypothetical protein
VLLAAAGVAHGQQGATCMAPAPAAAAAAKGWLGLQLAAPGLVTLVTTVTWVAACWQQTAAAAGCRAQMWMLQPVSCC